jgi:hypothetical protein
MIQRSRTALLAALALTLGARAAAAQTITSPYEYIEPSSRVGVTVGYLFTESDVRLTDSTSAALGPKSAPVFGVNYALRVSGPVSLEAGVSVSPTERQLYGPVFNADSTVITAEDLEVSVPATIVMGDVGLRFHLTGPRTWNGLAPFVAANAGITADVRGTFQEEREAGLAATELFRFGPGFALGAALGTDWFPTQRTSLRVEANGRLWRMRTPSGLLSNRDVDQREWNPVVGVSVGGAFHF